MTTQLAEHTDPNLAAVSTLERRRLDMQVRGQYQVVRELGRGGMGVVFLARDVALHRMVAIKVLRDEFVTSEPHRERFRREARLTARLTHPGIVPVYTFGESRDLVYLVMQYVNGESLAHRLPGVAKLSAAESLAILHDLAQALEYAHAQGLVHRDLKAENVLIERGTGRALLTDFGVARVRDSSPDLWEREHASGTPHYMSPEQAAGEPDLDRRSDIYSLGVLGYLMLSGTLPFDGSTFTALAAQHIVKAPVPLDKLGVDAPQPLVRAIMRCLAKERGDRFATAADFGTAITRITADNADRAVRRKIGARGWMRVTTVFAIAAALFGP
ncbi:MAG TPA: serine/threonine-protein kinase [Gemmatimonadaceae bacterium]|nr:serine/threonine-protein kinase [Gemmatimonadaceae bacterium]